METILIARERKSGKDVVLCDRAVGYPEQAAKYREFTNPVNEEYSSVELLYVTPCKKPLKFSTAAEQQARDQRRQEQEAAAKPNEATAPALPAKKSKNKR